MTDRKIPRDCALLPPLQVIEIGTGISGAAAGAVFQLLGAHVQKRLVAGQYVGLTSRECLLLQLLDSGKEVIEVDRYDDDLGDLREAIVVREINTPGSVELVSDAERASYCSRVAMAEAGSWVTISPYGLEGPRAGLRGCELAALAAGGVVAYMRSASGRPMKPAGYTGSLAAGLLGALAGLHGVMEARRLGHGVHHDLSMQDVVVVTGAFLESAHLLFECPGQGGSSRYAAPAGMFACADGFIEIVVLEDHQWWNLREVLGNPQWAAGIDSVDDRRANALEIQSHFEEWSRGFSARECASRLQSGRVPATVVNTAADLLGDKDLRARGFFEQRTIDGTEVMVPVLPAVARRSSRRPRSTSALPERDRIRVVDMSHVLAGPLGAAWLGAMGFNVLKVEDSDRLDSYRRRGPFSLGLADPERSAYFAAVNFSKRSVSLSYEQPGGRESLAGILRDADFVIENLSASRSARVLPESARGLSNACVISSSGFGRIGSERFDWRAYGHNIHAQGGLVHFSQDREGNPIDVGTAWADPLTAIWVALAVSAQSLMPADRGFDVDLSMSEVVAFQFMDLLAEHQKSGQDVHDVDSRLPGYAPHGVFAVGEEGWLALAVRTDDEWTRVVDALGKPASLLRDAYNTADGRIANESQLEADIELALAGLSEADALSRLQEAWIPCSSILSAEDLISDPHLAYRGLFQEIDHPVCGRRRVATLPWRATGLPSYRVTPPPIIGQHARDIENPWQEVPSTLSELQRSQRAG